MSPILADKRPACVAAKKSPRLVLGLGGADLGAKAAAQFLALGWDVCIAVTGEDARRFAVRGKAHVLALAVTGADLLATAKLVTALPKRTKVVLVGPTADAGLRRASGFLGAVAYAAESDGPDALVAAVLGACGN